MKAKTKKVEKREAVLFRILGTLEAILHLLKEEMGGRLNQTAVIPDFGRTVTTPLVWKVTKS